MVVSRIIDHLWSGKELQVLNYIHGKIAYALGIPSARLVMNILNKEKGAEDEVVDFYERYIKEMATDPVYAADGSRTGYFYDEDLLKN